MIVEKTANNFTQVEFPNNNDNILLGTLTGESLTTGNENIFIGSEAGRFNTTGNDNVYIGKYAGQQMTPGIDNVMIGQNAGSESLTGSQNTFVGRSAGENSYSGNGNTFLGYGSGSGNQNGSRNTYIGYETGIGNTNQHNNTYLGYQAGHEGDGSNNVFLGYNAGYNEAGSNKLYIENSNSATPLIYGEFDNDIVKINGRLLVSSGFSDADNDTKIQVEESADEDKIRFDLGGSEEFVIQKNAQGMTMLHLPNNNHNTFLGEDAGFSNHLNIDDGFNNTFIGYQTGYSNTLGNANVFIGEAAGKLNTTGNANTFVGSLSGINNTTGSHNTINGYGAGANNTTGSYNTFLGRNTGFSNSTGSYNIFLGYNAGYNEGGSNKLYIENSNSTTPLIYGEFDNDIVKINGRLLTTNGFSDADNDTKIQVEESTDEDKIRFDVNGTEMLVMAPNDGITSTGVIKANAGIYLPNAYGPDANYIGSAGNFISFGHSGSSEDFLGYKDNAFYFRDSPGGGDNTQPSVYAASFPTYSSRRWKHNIKNLDNALSIIQQLQGVTYTWNEDHGGHDDFGFIAEEVNKILPEIAPKNAEGEVDGVEYGQLTPYLVEAIKEQQTIINNQNQKIQRLEQQVQKIEKLETMLQQLQTQLSVSNH